MPNTPKSSDSECAELIKIKSNFLRGKLFKEINNPLTGAISDQDNLLLKFHGSYQQDDRDLRAQRQRQKLEPAYQFMVRVRMPGGVCTSDQWLSLDRLSRDYANGTLRLTSRQTFQFHGVLKHHLKSTIAGIHQCLLTTLATCGDVNRNVMCHNSPNASVINQQVFDLAAELSERLLPNTHAYHEIWLDQERVPSTLEHEPLYSERYLPRKFKIGIAVPPSNDVDIFSHDLGFIAIEEQGKLAGFNVVVGGGMAFTYGDPTTYPRLGDVIGFCDADRVVQVAETVIRLQRDEGDRNDRRHARFKYTIDRLGVDNVRQMLSQRLGFELSRPRRFEFTRTTDQYGWRQGIDRLWDLTLHIPQGRVVDAAECRFMSGLRRIAMIHDGSFRLTPSQNVMVSGVTREKKAAIDKVVELFGLSSPEQWSETRRNAMSCVAFPTCGLAMAESERFLPKLLDAFEQMLVRHGLKKSSLSLRLTGCPNGCARPFLAEIGLVGRSPGRYNLYLGGNPAGTRLNRLFKQDVPSTELITVLEPIVAHYAGKRGDGESFGDFVINQEYIKHPGRGSDFHNE